MPGICVPIVRPFSFWIYSMPPIPISSVDHGHLQSLRESFVCPLSMNNVQYIKFKCFLLSVAFFYIIIGMSLLVRVTNNKSTLHACKNIGNRRMCNKQLSEMSILFDYLVIAARVQYYKFYTLITFRYKAYTIWLLDMLSLCRWTFEGWNVTVKTEPYLKNSHLFHASMRMSFIGRLQNIRVLSQWRMCFLRQSESASSDQLKAL